MKNNVQSEDFCTTNWSVVLAAGDQSSEQWKPAIDYLYRHYWYPLYVYVRKRGYHDEAEDLIQGFFAHALEHELWRSLGPEKGRFRSFMLVCLKRYLTQHVRFSAAQKRGGGLGRFSIDSEQARNRYEAEYTDERTPEEASERSWALTVIEHAFRKLRLQYDSVGGGEVYAHLQDMIVPGSERHRLHEITDQLGMKDGTLRVVLHRMRIRFGKILRDEIAQTVASPDDVDSEVSFMLRILAR